MLKELSKPFQYPRGKQLTKGKQAMGQSAPQAGDTAKGKRRAKDWRGTLQRIWAYLAASKGKLGAVLCMVVASSVLALLGPFLIGRAIDDYIVDRSHGGLLQLLIGLAGVYAFYSLSLWLQNIWMIGIAQNTVYRMRTELFRHLHKLPISFFDKRRHGELMSRVTNDIDNVSSTLNSSFIQVISSVLTLLGTLSVMIWLSPLLTLLTLIVVPLLIYGLRWITSRTGRLFKEQQRNLGDMNGFIEETMSGQMIVKSFSLETQLMAEFRGKNERLKVSAFWAQTFTGFIPKLMNALNNLSFVIVAGIGGVFALNGGITIGTIVIFAEYSRQFTRPLSDLANQFNTVLSAVAGAERVFELLDEQEERNDELTAVSLERVEGHVQFSDVCFSYEQDGETISDLSFEAKPGETIALVGPTGAGKTTVINLLSRFYDADSGVIRIDGHDVKTIRRESLRAHMAFVLQDSFLFRGTIRDNIRYGRLDATDEEIAEAAKEANAHSFIMKLPDGYDTMLKHEGAGISQGQKQLISIARAIVANPAVLILDEATSSIDTITELQIQEALQRLMRGRTSFIIAHRLNTVRNADRIIVLKEGRVLEQGSHEELLRERGFYYELFAQTMK